MPLVNPVASSRAAPTLVVAVPATITPLPVQRQLSASEEGGLPVQEQAAHRPKSSKA
jgi:hypothetical protein